MINHLNRFTRVLAAVAVLSLASGASQAAEPVKVKIDSGTLVGSSDDGVNLFKGVPFAKPPVGALRWRAPQKPDAFKGEFQATSFALPCPQPVNADGSANGGGVSGPTKEDCLYLNVWAPKNAKNAPVMLWLYGGAGYLGAGHLGSYQGTSFAKKGVIIVTINYRLGMLGSFAHPAVTKATPAGEAMDNYALMDAIAGLQWVQRNIAAFGGDKTNVTLFGQSAGGAMVSSLLSSPAAKGLYEKAAVHSGAAISGGLTQAEGEDAGAKIATALGLPGAAATIEQLRALTPEQMFANTASRSGVRTVVDGKIKTVSTGDALKAHTDNDVPLIVGSNSGEGGADGAKTLVDLASAGAASWQYYFSYVPAWRTTEQPNGAPHSAEIPYAFAALATSTTGGGARVTDRDRAVAERMNSCWVAFAKMPATSHSIDCAGGFSWPARSQTNDAIAVFSETPSAAKATPIVEAQAAAAKARAAATAARTAAK